MLKIIFDEESTAATLLLEMKILRPGMLFPRQKTTLDLKITTYNIALRPITLFKGNGNPYLLPV